MDVMRQFRDSASLIVKTLTVDQLEQLDLAIVSRDPPTYTACYKQFQLRDLGISFDVFYRYARKLRTNLRAAALANHNVPDPDNSETLLPKLVCQRMVETLLTEKLSPRALLRLAESYRMTAQIEIQRRRLDIAEEMTIHRIGVAADQRPQLPACQSDAALPSSQEAPQIEPMETHENVPQRA